MSEHILSVHDLDVNEGQIPREDWFESSDTLHHLRKNKKFPNHLVRGLRHRRGDGIVDPRH